MNARTVLAWGVTALGLLAFQADAHAGVYTVSACDAAGGANASWFGTRTHGGLAVYSRCPSGGLDDAGLVTRASGQPAGWTVPGGAAARWVFRAPPGAAVVGLRASARFHRRDSNWRTAIMAGSRFVVGCHGGISDYPCGGLLHMSQHIPVPPSATINTETHCIRTPCNVSWQRDFPGNVWARFLLYGVTVYISDSTRPSVGVPRGALWTSRWVGARRSVAFDAVDNVGIREVRVAIDGRVLRGASRDCSGAALRCPDWRGATLDVPTTESKDGARRLSLIAVDRAGNVGSLSRTIYVDNTPPAAPEDVAVVGGDRWRSSNSFSVAWRNPPQAGRSPIAGVFYELCPSDGPSSECVRASKMAPGVSQLDGLSVPKPGEWLLRTWLRDAAGNARRETAAAPVRLRYDPQPPTVGLLPFNPEAPTHVGVLASDAISGIARGEVEIRRRGEPTWRSLATTRAAGGFAAVFDDVHLTDGIYDVRARVFDAAGNERSTDRRTSGARAELHLPVRVPTRLRVGKPRRVAAGPSGRRKRRLRTVYVRRPRTEVGRRVRIGGRLTAPGGNALQGAPIEVSAKVHAPGQQYRPVATLTTSRTGRFEYLVPAGPNRTLRFHNPGANKIRPQTRRVSIRVRGASRIRVSRQRVVNGESVTFRGRLRGGWIPAAGKLVEVQFFARGKWRTFATTRADANGRWRYAYRFDGTRGTVRWRFRALIPRETGYPFT